MSAAAVADVGTKTAIHTEMLCKSYGSRPALVDVDLTVRTGEIYGFLGPNGAGKTTVIRVLLDLLRPTSGTVEVLGGDPRRSGTAVRRRLGYLPGEFVIYGSQSVGEALAGLARLRGGVPHRRIVELAEGMELDMHRRVGELSKGNRQKVGLVQAFMHDPELLILDEPTDGLDPLLRQRFIEMVQQVRADGRTVFLSSHILSEVQATADRIGMIRGGSIVAVDTVRALRNRAVRRVEMQFHDTVTAAEFCGLPFLEDVVVTAESDLFVLRCHLTGSADLLVKTAARHRLGSLRVEEPDLEEVFMTLYQADHDSSRPGNAGP